MELIAIIQKAWGWTGITPVQVIGDNDFGNLIIKDRDGYYWRLCPEDLYCKIIAHSRTELDQLSQNQEFLRDWYMTNLVQHARICLGPLQLGFKYCLKIPSLLGGEYGGDNIGVISLAGLISASGHVAQQIENLSDGTKVKFNITD